MWFKYKYKNSTAADKIKSGCWLKWSHLLSDRFIGLFENVTNNHQRHRRDVGGDGGCSRGATYITRTTK